MNLSCESHKLEKHCRSSYVLSNNKSTIPFGIVDFDVWGLAPMTSLHGFHYFVMFSDKFFQITWVNLLKKKNEVFPVFETFRKMVKIQFDAKIKIIRSNNGSEYFSHSFSSYNTANGMLH